MMKKLVLFNGRWFDRGKTGHAYIAAHSVADAARMCEQIAGCRGWNAEIKNYFSKGCWGTKMIGITPERGLWVDLDEYGTEKPKRVL